MLPLGLIIHWSLSWGQTPQNLKFLNLNSNFPYFCSTQRGDGVAAGVASRAIAILGMHACEHSFMSSAAALQPAARAKTFPFMILDEPLVATADITWGAGGMKGARAGQCPLPQSP